MNSATPAPDQDHCRATADAGHLFISGMMRSGTSLAAILLSQHPEISLLPQPLPLLYVEIKRRFFQKQSARNLDSAPDYPLSDLFADQYLDPRLFERFLIEYFISPDCITEVLDSMRDYSGQYFKPTEPVSAFIPSQDMRFYDFVTAYLRRAVGARVLSVIGSKETNAEEYIPLYLDRGSKVLLILRDPRDVVASVFGGRGSELAGGGRPLLFVLRHWRKSVAYALRHAGFAGFRVVRYEDLVREPMATLDELSGWLGVESHQDCRSLESLRDHNGQVWASNSSHRPLDGVSRQSVGAHRLILPNQVRRAVEILCAPEMRALGYAPTATKPGELQQPVLPELSEYCTERRAELEAYVWGPQSLKAEIQRLRTLASGQFRPSLHLFEESFGRLAPARPRCKTANPDVQTLVEPRASTILFNLAAEARPGFFLLPANVCPEVPLAIAAAGREFRFVDIDPVTRCANTRAVLEMVKSNGQRVAGLIFVRTYGALFDLSAFFCDLKSTDPALLIVDDRCACRPLLRERMADPAVDAEVYSTGYSKYLDLGYGGFAYLRHDLDYVRREARYDPDHESALRSHFSELQRNPVKALKPGRLLDRVREQWPHWLNTEPIGSSPKELMTRLHIELPAVDQHKFKLNKIYRNCVPAEARLGPEFNAWRFCIAVKRKLELLDAIFSAGLFASSHYPSATHLFGGAPMPETDRLHARVINLFNDRHADENYARALGRLVQRHLLTEGSGVSSGVTT